MALEVVGKLHIKGDTEQITQTFKKREFVLEMSEMGGNGMTYTNYGSFQLVNNACDSLDQFQEGEEIKVSFNIRGNRWENNGKVKYITNLNAWRIERAMGAQMPNAGMNQGFNAAPAQFNQPTQQSPINNSNPFGGGNQNDADDLPF